MVLLVISGLALIVSELGSPFLFFFFLHFSYFLNLLCDNIFAPLLSFFPSFSFFLFSFLFVFFLLTQKVASKIYDPHLEEFLICAGNCSHGVSHGQRTESADKPRFEGTQGCAKLSLGSGGVVGRLV